MTMKLTPWHPPHIKPVRVGDYNASAHRDEAVMRHWNGSKWSLWWVSSERSGIAEYRAKIEAPNQNKIHWRGLAAPHTGKKRGTR